MSSKLSKIGLATVLTCAALIGVTISSRSLNVSGMKSHTTILSLGVEAKAYCNEANGGPTEPWNTGQCSGTANQPASRCFQATSNQNCVQS